MQPKYLRDIGEFLVPVSVILLFVYALSGGFALLTPESRFLGRFVVYLALFVLYPAVAGVYCFLAGWKEWHVSHVLVTGAAASAGMAGLLALKLFFLMLRGRGNLFMAYQPLDFGTEFTLGVLGALLLGLGILGKRRWYVSVPLGALLIAVLGGLAYLLFT